MHGNLSAIPESIVAVDTANPADLSNGDFIISWRAARIGYPIMCIYLLSFGIMQCLALWIPLPIPQATFPYYAGDPVWYKVLIYSPIVLLLVEFLPLYLLLRNRHIIIRATHEGIVRKPLIGRKRLIRWNEARLLEVDVRQSNLPDAPYQRSYALYSARRMIWWEEAYTPKATFVQDDISVEEAAERNQQLMPRELA